MLLPSCVLLGQSWSEEDGAHSFLGPQPQGWSSLSQQWSSPRPSLGITRPPPARAEQISKGSSVQAVFGAHPMEQGWEEQLESCQWGPREKGLYPRGGSGREQRGHRLTHGKVHCPWEGHTTPQSLSQPISCNSAFSFLFYLLQYCRFMTHFFVFTEFLGR